MKRSLKRGILAASVAAIGLASGTAMAENDVAAMREQVEAMKERVAKIEAERETKKRIAAAASVEAGSRPRSWKLPGTNTSMSIGGYVKADFIWDMNAPAGDKFSQDSDSLAVDNSVAARKQGQFRFHARSSRLFVRTDTPTDWGALVTYFEADFFGGSTSVSSQVNNGYFANSDFRLRHAYGQLGPVLAGQTTSLFLPSSYFGEIIDAGGPVGTNTNRRGQLRYTHVFPGGFSLAASIEDPGSPGRTVCATNSPSTICSAGLATNPVFTYPEFVVSGEYNFANGRVWLGGLLRNVQNDTGAGQHEENWGYQFAMAF
ncbi:MAG: DcaP family trimeric outer membrane transporter, partial [Alphaproteobacteria bacterium]